MQAELAVLEERGIIHRKSLLTGDEFRFGESLTQEVAYEGLLLRQRRELHDRIGQLLESMPGETERRALGAPRPPLCPSENRGKRDHGAPARRPRRRAHPIVPDRRALLSERLRPRRSRPRERPGDERGKRVVVDTAVGILRMSVIYGIYEHGDPKSRRGGAGSSPRRSATTRVSPSSARSTASSSAAVAAANFAAGHALIEQGLAIAERAGLKLAAIRISRALAWDDLFDGRFTDALARIDPVVQDFQDSARRRSKSSATSISVRSSCATASISTRTTASTRWRRRIARTSSP